MKKLKTVCCLCNDDIHDGPLSKDMFTRQVLKGLELHGYCGRCAAAIYAFARDEGSKDETAAKRD